VSYWGNAGAGILLQAADTGRVMLVLRSGYVNEPFTWGLPGGRVDEGEAPLPAALRELSEETGYDGPFLDIDLLHVYQDGAFRFFNYRAVVPEEIEPALDWESIDYGWFERDELPSPLHFGLQHLVDHDLVPTRRARNVARRSSRRRR